MAKPRASAKAQSPRDEELVDAVAQILEKVPPARLDDALALIAVLHPRQQAHRTVFHYMFAATGIAMLAIATGACFAPSPKIYLLIPIVMGGLLSGSVLAAINGRPASLKEMGETVQAFRATLGQGRRIPEIQQSDSDRTDGRPVEEGQG